MPTVVPGGINCYGMYTTAFYWNLRTTWGETGMARQGPSRIAALRYEDFQAS